MKSIYCMVGILFMLLQGSWQNPLQETEDKTRSVSRRNAVFERHAEGTYTSDMSNYLEAQAVKEFIDWLIKGRPKRNFNEVTKAAEEMNRRHADGSFTNDINKVLDTMAAKEFLDWLINAKVTERSLLEE
ncbi:pro-glucagon-like isoform X5 [Ascaphus truei]|uniref:pro-glucagon-like isoform X5 n=1 Tax=Ascaphus truei TaxID=8439 RepID=UPI003F5AD7A0